MKTYFRQRISSSELYQINYMEIILLEVFINKNKNVGNFSEFLNLITC